MSFKEGGRFKRAMGLTSIGAYLAGPALEDDRHL